MDEPRIVLISRLPDDWAPDVLYVNDAGFAVLAMAADIKAFQDRGIAVAQLYASFDAWAAAVGDLTAADATVAVTNDETQALAALESADRNQFPVA